MTMAGITQMPLPLFLVLDGLGALLFIGTAAAVGWTFQHEITDLIARLAALGLWGLLATILALGAFMAAKWLQRQLFIRSLRMRRITVEELRRLINEGKTVLILDVRPLDVRTAHGIIPGAVAGHATEIDVLIGTYPREQEIIIYCACPNEASAASAAKHLRRAGFKRIRPLLGGIDAWVEAGCLLEQLAPP